MIHEILKFCTEQSWTNWGNCTSCTISRTQIRVHPVRALILNAQPEQNLSRVRSTPSLLTQEINTLKTTEAAGAVQQDIANCIVMLIQHQGHIDHLHTGHFRNRSNTRVATEFFSGYYKNFLLEEAKEIGVWKKPEKGLLRSWYKNRVAFLNCAESPNILVVRDKLWKEGLSYEDSQLMPLIALTLF